MRSPLVVSRSKLLYLGLCAFNFGAALPAASARTHLRPTYAPGLLSGAGLRFIWALSIFGGVPGRSWGMFFFEVVEMARSHLPRISAASPCPSWTR